MPWKERALGCAQEHELLALSLLDCLELGGAVSSDMHELFPIIIRAWMDDEDEVARDF